MADMVLLLESQLAAVRDAIDAVFGTDYAARNPQLVGEALRGLVAYSAAAEELVQVRRAAAAAANNTQIELEICRNRLTAVAVTAEAARTRFAPNLPISGSWVSYVNGLLGALEAVLRCAAPALGEGQRGAPIDVAGVVHESQLFAARCGADAPSQSITEVTANVTCATCIALRARGESRAAKPATKQLRKPVRLGDLPASQLAEIVSDVYEVLFWAPGGYVAERAALTPGHVKALVRVFQRHELVPVPCEE